MKASEALLAATRRIDRFDAELLLAHLLGIDRLAMLAGADRDVDFNAFDALVTRRAGGEPLAYITGRREFWSRDLAAQLAQVKAERARLRGTPKPSSAKSRPSRRKELAPLRRRPGWGSPQWQLRPEPIPRPIELLSGRPELP